MPSFPSRDPILDAIAHMPAGKKMDASCWEMISEDLFTRILNKLEPKSRVADVVLVCKRWSSLCHDNPPQQQALTLSLRLGTASAGATYLSWLSKSGKAARKTELLLNDSSLSRSVVAQTLSVLAVSQPHLRELGIILAHDPLHSLHKCELQGRGVYWNNWCGCLPLFTQLEKLSLQGLQFITGVDSDDEEEVDEDELTADDIFDGLALKELEITAREFPRDAPVYTIALGRALYALTQLTRLSLNLVMRTEGHHDGYMSGLTTNIAKMQSLRDLRVETDAGITIPSLWSSLTSLTSLVLRGSIGSHQNLSSLESLESMELTATDARWGFALPGTNQAPLVAANTLTGLTHLTLHSLRDGQEDLGSLLPEAGLRGLQNLEHLGLEMRLASLPPHLLRALPGLKFLRLSNNLFERVPPTITYLAQLEALVLTNNPPFQLSLECVEVLASMPSLEFLFMAKGGRQEGVWSMDCFDAISALKARLPSLRLGLTL